MFAWDCIIHGASLCECDGQSEQGRTRVDAGMDGLNAPSKYTEWVQLQVFTLGNVYVVIILMLVSVLTVGLPILPTLIGAISTCLLALKANQSLT